MPGRDQVLALVRRGLPYEEIARRLRINPGLAYLIATGRPADGSDAPAATAAADNPTSKESVRRWVHARVAADAAMRAAADARDAVPPEPPFGEDTPDVVDVLVRDHNRVTAMLKQLAAIPGATKGGTPAQRSARISIVDLVMAALSRHEAAEERHLWPAVRRVLPDGDALAEEALAQEQHGKEVLQAFTRLDGTSEADHERFDDLVAELTAGCRTHVAFEEQVFLRLRDQMPAEDLRRLGEKVDAARRHGPTRPHPHAPATPPAVDVAGAAGAAMDHARDALGHRPADRKGRASADAERRTEESTEADTEDDA